MNKKISTAEHFSKENINGIVTSKNYVTYIALQSRKKNFSLRKILLPVFLGLILTLALAVFLYLIKTVYFG